jgi:hypothetical protein
MRRTDPALGLGGKLLFDEHTDATLVNARCGVVWGEMAPPGDKPGTLHWCAREMVTVPDPDNPDDGSPAVSHPGKHRCTCGDYHAFEPAPFVVCRFPTGGIDGPECGVHTDGFSRTLYRVEGSIMAHRAPATYAVVTSKPCGHVVRRGF